MEGLWNKQTYETTSDSNADITNFHLWATVMINATYQKRIDGFEMTRYRRGLYIPWTAKRTNTSVLNEFDITDWKLLLPTIRR